MSQAVKSSASFSMPSTTLAWSFRRIALAMTRCILDPTTGPIRLESRTRPGETSVTSAVIRNSPKGPRMRSVK